MTGPVMPSDALWLPAIWLAQFALETTVEILNLGALRRPLPPSVLDLHTPERLETARRYTRARTRFGLVASTAELLLLITCWALGGFGILDRWIRSLGWGEIPTGLAFLASLALANGLLMLPFRWYGTFVLEARFGFNRTSLATFVKDTVLGVLLAVAIGAPVLAGVLWLLARLGPSAWWICWAAGAGWTIVLQYVAPTWLLPLFFRFSPLPDDGLRAAIVDYAGRVGFPLAGISIVDGSRRSSKANAFFTGFGRRRRIALFDTLLASLSRAEIVAVVAHEIGHARLHHTLVGLGLGVLELGGTCLALAWALTEPTLTGAIGISTHSPHAAILAFGLVVGPVQIPIRLALNALSRRHEYAADRFAAATLGESASLVGGLRRLATDTLTNLTPHPAWVALHASHPPMVERIRALEAIPRA